MSVYYEEPGITVYHAKAEDVLPTLDAGSVDLVCVDPPYGTTQLTWDRPLDWSALWPELYRVCTPLALQVMFSNQPFTTDLIMSNRKRYRYDLIWPKTMPTGFLDANRRPLRAHEIVCVFGDRFEGTTYNPQKTRSATSSHRVRVGSRPASHYSEARKTSYEPTFERYPTTVLPTFSNGNANSQHETTKPLDLISWLIQTYSNPGDLVLDFCCGSGSTLEACKRLGRRCIGIDVRESCVELTVARLAQSVLPLEVTP